MSRTVSATEARIHLGALLDDIERDEAIMVEQAGAAETAVIPMNEAKELSGTSAGSPDWKKSLERARALIRADLGDQELPIDDIIHRMREERSAELYDALH